MDVQDVMKSKVTSVNPSTSLEEATGLMENENLDWLPVVEDGRVMGTLSAEKAASQNQSRPTGHKTQVRDAMDYAMPPCCGTNDPLFSVVVRMRKEGLRQMLVLAAGNRPLGVITSEDANMKPPGKRRKPNKNAGGEHDMPIRKKGAPHLLHGL